MSQQVAVPKRDHLAVLPSGRVLEFGNVIDAEMTGNEECKLTQVWNAGSREITLIGEDARAAMSLMVGISLIVMRNTPPLVIANKMPGQKPN